MRLERLCTDRHYISNILFNLEYCMLFSIISNSEDVAQAVNMDLRQVFVSGQGSSFLSILITESNTGPRVSMT